MSAVRLILASGKVENVSSEKEGEAEIRAAGHTRAQRKNDAYCPPYLDGAAEEGPSSSDFTAAMNAVS